MRKILWATLFFWILIWAHAAQGADLTLTWTDNSNNEDGFNVERKTTQAGAFSQIGSVAQNVTTYVDAVSDGQLYCYRVNAFNGAGVSPWSAEACGTILTTPLAPTVIVITITVTPPTP